MRIAGEQGIDLKGITLVVQYDILKDPNTLMQHFGWAVRDPSLQAIAVLFVPPSAFDKEPVVKKHKHADLVEEEALPPLTYHQRVPDTWDGMLDMDIIDQVDLVAYNTTIGMGAEVDDDDADDTLVMAVDSDKPQDWASPAVLVLESLPSFQKQDSIVLKATKEKPLLKWKSKCQSKVKEPAEKVNPTISKLINLKACQPKGSPEPCLHEELNVFYGNNLLHGFP